MAFHVGFGIVLIIMVLIHFAIMHVITDIRDINFAFSKRFMTCSGSARPAMLILALFHGRTVCASSSMTTCPRGPGVDVWPRYVVGLVFLVVGAVTLGPSDLMRAAQSGNSAEDFRGRSDSCKYDVVGSWAPVVPALWPHWGFQGCPRGSGQQAHPHPLP
jgi:hypothetical protein